MKLSEIKDVLPGLSKLAFCFEDETSVPAHFHVTEVGIADKIFIDCGGTIRTEKKVIFQLWTANDYDHRLQPVKLLDIIKLSEEKLGPGDYEVEVEYQAGTIGRYSLDFNSGTFLLKNIFTACLATDACGVPAVKLKKNLRDLTAASCCAPDSGCC